MKRFIGIKTGREVYQGEGSMKCYGQMSVAIEKWDDGVGTASCRPVVSGAAPQGYVADGSDGSHWVLIFCLTKGAQVLFKFRTI